MSKLEKMTKQVLQTSDQSWQEYYKKEGYKSSLLGKIIFQGKIKVVKNIINNLNVKSALDVGCGQGVFTKVFSDQGINTLGIDIIPIAVEMCKKKGLIAKKQDLSNVKKKYDLVFSDGLLDHHLNFPFYIRLFTKISNKYVVVLQSNHESPLYKLLLFFQSIIKPAKIYEFNFRISDYVEVFKKNKFILKKGANILLGSCCVLLFQKIPWEIKPKKPV